MPPKAKYTREEILKAAMALTREKGAAAVTSRALGRRIGCSVCPIFSVFGDMEELNAALREQAWGCFDEYMKLADSYNPAYKKRGMQWVSFACEEPQLFKLLFMSDSDNSRDFDEMIEYIPFGKARDVEIIMRDYGATREQAEHLFRQLWVYTYGLCVLCATGACSFTEPELAQRLGEVFQGMVYVIKYEKEGIAAVRPAALGSAESAEIQNNHPNFEQKD